MRSAFEKRRRCLGCRRHPQAGARSSELPRGSLGHRRSTYHISRRASQIRHRIHLVFPRGPGVSLAL